MATNKVVTKVVADTSEHDSALRRSEAEVLKYSQRVKNTNNEMRDLSTNLGKASSSMSTFIGSLNTGKIGSLTSSLQGLSSAFGGLGGNIGNLSTSLGSIGGSITSLINPYALLGTAVVGAGTAFYNFNKTLDETTRKVGEVLGVSRDIAMPIRNSIQAIADTYGVEFGDVLNSVNTLMSQFGISSEEALDIVSRGFQSMGDSGDSILPLIQQFAPQFRDAGVEASELMAIIANTRGGIFSEEGMAAIAMAGKNIRNMSEQTIQSLEAIGIDTNKMINDLTNGNTTVMQEIIKIANKLSELPPQSQQVGSVLQDVFGRQGVRAGQELITSLSEVETNLDTMKGKTGEWGESMDDLRAANERLQNQLSSMFGTAEGGFDLIGTKIRTEVLTALSDFIDEVKDVYENSLLLQGAWMTVSTAVQVAWSLIKNVLQMFAGTLVGLEQMIEGLALAIEATFEMKDPIKGLQKFEKGWNKLSRAIGDNISDIGGDWEKLYKKYGGERTDSDKPLKHQSEGNTRIGNTWYDANGNKIDDPEKKKTKQVVIPTGKTPKGGGKKSSGKSTPSVPKGIEAPTLTLGVNIDQSELDKVTEQWVNSLPSQLEEVKNKYAEIFENTNAQSLMENNTASFEMFTDKINEQAEAFGYYAQILGSVSQALGVLGDSAVAQAVQFGVNTAAILANAAKEVIAMRATAMANGLANSMKLPFPANLAEWAILASTIASVFASLPSFAEGGIFSGNRTIGDMNLARVNSGEMILNGKQQRNLFNIINYGALGGGSDSNNTVHFRVSGNDLVGVLNNYNNKRSKAR